MGTYNYQTSGNAKSVGKDFMEGLKILESQNSLNWEFDEEADVLYISIGEPRPAVGTDIGDGIVVRLDEEKNEIVGITIIGFRERTARSLLGNN